MVHVMPNQQFNNWSVPGSRMYVIHFTGELFIRDSAVDTSVIPIQGRVSNVKALKI